MRILGTLFDSYHLGYIFVSLAFTILMVWWPTRYIKQQKHKDIYLKTWAWLTVFLHLSPLWVDFLKGSTPVAADSMLFPIYFCNMSMYFLVIVAIWGNKKTKTFNRLATVAAYAGVFGALISLFYPEYYVHGGSMFEWGVFKSMLSHSTMLIGSLYLFVGGYFKIDKFNVVTYFIGLLFIGLIGIIVNATFALAGLNPPNAMYLQHPPLADVPFLNVFVIAAMMLVLVFAISSTVVYFRKKQSHKDLNFIHS